MNLKENDWNFGGSIKYLNCDGKGSYLAKVKASNGMLITTTLNGELLRRGVKLAKGDHVKVRCPGNNQYEGKIFWHKRI